MKLRRAEYLTTSARPGDFPREGLPELAFLGRSNVGKSSLINRLTQRKNLARTSSTPGKTRLIHFFQVEVGERACLLADLPGYGYAKVSRAERQGWQRLVESYLENRTVLRVAVLLQDIRRDVSDDELLLLEWLAERGVPSLVAVTKADKLKPMRRAHRLRELRAAFDLPAERVLATSSQTGLGIPELWKALYAAI